MEKHQRIARQVLARDLDNIPRPRKERMRLPYAPFGLPPARPQPLAGESEALAAMVVLAVADPNRPSILEDGAVFRHAVRYTGNELREMQHGVGIVTDPEQKHLPVPVMHAANGAVRDVRRKRQRA
jgi:hypothetical protein